MSKTILVVDDDDSILELYELLLQGEGYTVRTSRIIFEHVADIAQLDPALVIVDLKLGGHNQGLTLVQKMRLYRPTAHIPIIVCSAAINELKMQEEKLKQEGIPLIFKPFNIDELLQAVEEKMSISPAISGE